MTRNSHMATMRHELFEDMAAQVAMILTENNVPEDVAKDCGAAVANHMGAHWGGQHITVPKDYLWGISNRDLVIWDEFTGDNHMELARKYNLTVNGIYRLLKRIRNQAIGRNQPDLF